MQQRIEGLLNQLLKLSERLVNQVMRWALRGMRLLEQFWSWFQSIDWPEIPLTQFQWVTLFFVIFSVIFGLATPIFEAGDEVHHFAVVEHIVTTGELPVVNPSPDEMVLPTAERGNEPPAYYLLAAAKASVFDISDADQYRQLNPYARVELPYVFGNKNLFLRDSVAPIFEGTPLAVYSIRLMGIVFGAVTLWLVYRIARVIAPQRPIAGLVALLLTAFNPMFIYISASVNNTSLAMLLNAGVIYLAVLTLRDGFTLKKSALLGVLVGLALLTKLTAWALVPIVIIVGAWVARRDKNLPQFGFYTASLLIGFAVIAGWWYARNLTLYGEFFGWHTMAQTMGNRIEPYSIITMLNEFQPFRLSYWGLFGINNILTSTLFYALVDFAVFMSMGGIVFLVAQLISIRHYSYIRRELAGIVALLGIVLFGMIGYFWWASQTTAYEGTILFPLIGAISPLLAVGVVEIVWWLLFILSPTDRPFLQANNAVTEPVLRQAVVWPARFFGLIVLLIPLTSIAPQYIPPAPLDALPTSVRPVYADYGAVELIGYTVTDRRYTPGERVPVTLYWRAKEATDDNLTLSLALVNPAGESLGSMNTYPGAGRLQTSTWQTGAIYADPYELVLSPLRVDGRYPVRLQVYWKNDDDLYLGRNREGDDLSAVMLNTGAVLPITEFVQPAGYIPVTAVFPDVSYPGEFQDIFRLISFDFDFDEKMLSLVWQSAFATGEDYTVFAHVYDENGELIGQKDVFPQLPTSYWRSGEHYITDHPFRFTDIADSGQLPEGTYTVKVGWYVNDGADLPRLILKGDDPENPEDAMMLFTFEVDADGEITTPDVPELMLTDTPTGTPETPVSEPVDTPEATVTDDASG